MTPEVTMISIKPLQWIERDWKAYGRGRVFDVVEMESKMVLFRLIECSAGWELSDEMKGLKTIWSTQEAAKKAAWDVHVVRIQAMTIAHVFNFPKNKETEP